MRLLKLINKWFGAQLAFLGPTAQTVPQHKTFQPIQCHSDKRLTKSKTYKLSNNRGSYKHHERISSKNKSSHGDTQLLFNSL